MERRQVCIIISQMESRMRMDRSMDDDPTRLAACGVNFSWWPGWAPGIYTPPLQAAGICGSDEGEEVQEERPVDGDDLREGFRAAQALPDPGGRRVLPGAAEMQAHRQGSRPRVSRWPHQNQYCVVFIIMHTNNIQVVTGCTMDELRRMDQAGIGGDAMSGSVFIAKRFELRNCRHKASPDFTSSHCIKDLIADSNPHHYGVAAQNAELREGLREILGVPLLFVNRGVLLMEQPAKKTLSHAKSLELQKLKPAEFELKAITAKLGEEASTPTPIDKLKKKKKMKGRKQPNPLSVKKTSKNKKGEVVASSAAGAPPEGVHKPKRKRKPKKKAASDHTASSSS